MPICKECRYFSYDVTSEGVTRLYCRNPLNPDDFIFGGMKATSPEDERKPEGKCKPEGLLFERKWNVTQ